MTLLQLYRQVTEKLKDCDTPALDARVLIMDVLKLDSSRFILESNCEVSEKETAKIFENAEKRAEGLPVAYITGHKDFWKYSFKTRKGVLVPQADTETLVETVINEELKFKDLEVLDVCTGTGCIGISIALELAARGKNISLTLSDISPVAVETARFNADKLLKEGNVKYEILQGDMFNTVKGRKFDIIVSNPPYINTDIIKNLPREVKAEPSLALDGGKDGLDFVRILGKDAFAYIKKDGILAFEIGYDQGQSSIEIMNENGWKNVEIIRDLGQRDRVVKCRF